MPPTASRIERSAIVHRWLEPSSQSRRLPQGQAGSQRCPRVSRTTFEQFGKRTSQSQVRPSRDLSIIQQFEHAPALWIKDYDLGCFFSRRVEVRERVLSLLRDLGLAE